MRFLIGQQHIYWSLCCLIVHLTYLLSSTILAVTETFSTDALIVMTLCLFCSHEEETIGHPLSALLYFLREYSNTSANDFAVTATHLQPVMAILQSKTTSNHPLDPDFDRHTFRSTVDKDVELEDRHRYPLRHEVLKILWKNSRRYHSIHYSAKGVYTTETMGGVKSTIDEATVSSLGLIKRNSVFYSMQDGEQWERNNRLIVLDPIDGKTNLCYIPIDQTSKFPRLKMFLGTTPNLQNLFDNGLRQLNNAISWIQFLGQPQSEGKALPKGLNNFLSNISGSDRGENLEANGNTSVAAESETARSDPSGVTSELGNSVHVSDNSEFDGSHLPVRGLRAIFEATFKRTIELVDLKSLSRSESNHVPFLTKLESFNLYEIKCTFTEQDLNGNREAHMSDSMGSYQYESTSKSSVGETSTEVSSKLSKWSDRRQNSGVFTMLSVSLADIEARIREAETILSPEVRVWTLYPLLLSHLILPCLL